MSSTLFITGASGFVGTHLLRRLDPQEFKEIICLSRSSRPPAAPGVRFVRGDLFEPDAYAHALASADTVVHLAAATGNATSSEHFRVNAEGTALLVRRCEALGVRRFLHVSSIAVRFGDIRYYPYAQSKRLAEQSVRGSNLRYTIIRPTIVLGRGSAIGERLQTLAAGVVTPIIGPGTTRIQPIDVDDLVKVIVSIIRADRFNGEVLEIGGPDVLTIEDLLGRMHQVRRGKKAWVIHIPFWPLVTMLGALERIPVRLPVRAGQLASFMNDGTAQPNDLVARDFPRMKRIRDMLQVSADD
jgi:nucleoside-diphosphate-sugar epimerase